MAKRTTITIPDDLVELYELYTRQFSVNEVAVAAVRSRLEICETRDRLGEYAARALERVRGELMGKTEPRRVAAQEQGRKYAAETASLYELESASAWLNAVAEKGEEVNWIQVMDEVFHTSLLDEGDEKERYLKVRNKEWEPELQQAYAQGFLEGIAEVYRSIQDKLPKHIDKY